MLGQFYFKKGFYDQALTVYQSLLDRHPGDRDLLESVNITRKKLGLPPLSPPTSGSGSGSGSAPKSPAPKPR
jgi:hypothetical protein